MQKLQKHLQLLVNLDVENQHLPRFYWIRRGINGKVDFENKNIGEITVEERDKKTVSAIQMVFKILRHFNPSHSVGIRY